MVSYFEPNFIENLLWESVFFFFFLILAKIEMTQNKNRLFDRHYETVHFIFFFYLFIYLFIISFFRIMGFFIVRTYVVQISLQNSGGKVFYLEVVPWKPTWAPKGVKVPWSRKC